MRRSESLRYEGRLILFWRRLVDLAEPLGTIKLLTLCEADLEKEVVEQRARVDVTLGQATEADVNRIVATAIAGHDPRDFPADRRRRMRQVLVDYFRRGDLCFVATVGKEIVHSNWMRFARSGPILVTPGRYLILEEGQAYMTDGFTAVPYRGKGVHGAVNSHMLAYLKKAGYRRSHTFFVSDNVTSWRGLKRVGWTIRARLLTLERKGEGRDALVWRLRGNPTNWLQRLPPS